MSDLLTHIGRLELVDVDLDKEPQCESTAHERTTAYECVACAGPAAFWVRPPCGHSGLRCAQRIVRYTVLGTVVCGICADRARPYEYVIVEL